MKPHYPLASFGVLFALGIVAAQFLMETSLLPIYFLVSGLLGVLYFLCESKIGKTTTIFTLVFCLGVHYFFFYQSLIFNSETASGNSVFVIKTKKNTQSDWVSFKVNYINNPTLLNGYEQVNLYLYKSNFLQIGDTIVTDKTPKTIQPPINKYEANFKRINFIKGVDKQLFLRKDFCYLKGENKKTIKDVKSIIHKGLTKNIRDSSVVNFVEAITIGDKEYLDSELREQFSSLGLAHLLAVSGLHVGVIYGSLFLLWMWVFGNRHRKLRAIIFIILFTGFGFLAEWSASVTRAVLIIYIYQFGIVINRSNNFAHAVFLSWIMFLLYDPLALFSIGFQLSYSAVFGILFIGQPLVSHLFVKNRYFKYVVDLLIISVVAQWSTLPFVLYYFGQFSSGFLISNLIGISLFSLLVPIGLFFLIVSLSPISITYLGDGLTWIFYKMTDLFQWMQSSTNTLYYQFYISDWEFMIFVTAVIISFFWNVFGRFRFYIPLVSVILFAVFIAFFQSRKSKVMSSIDKQVWGYGGNQFWVVKKSDSAVWYYQNEQPKKMKFIRENYERKNFINYSIIKKDIK